MTPEWLDENVNNDPVPLPGDHVLARWEGGMFWFPGTLVRSNASSR